MMITDELKQWRIKRLRDFVDAIGEAKKAGVTLGYKDGAYIGQMLDGARPISEKTVAKIEGLHGYAGWFAPAPAPSLLTAVHIQPARPSGGFSPSAEELAMAFDAIPLSENFARIQAFNAASMAILEVLQDLKARGHAIPGLGK